MVTASYSPLDGALEILADYGIELSNGNFNHAPMVAEALCAMDRPEAVMPWIARYRERMRSRPAAGDRIAHGDWRNALGRRDRFADWALFFAQELHETAWPRVLDHWVTRLAPGFSAAAMHGVIRVGHATRALGEAETTPRLRELGDALASWAASYQELPSSDRTGNGAMPPHTAIRTIPIIAAEARRSQGNITSSLAMLDAFPEFASVIGLIDLSGDIDRRLAELTDVFARVYLANAHDRLTAIVFIHGVTSLSALGNIIPAVSETTARTALHFAWQSGCALYTCYGSGTCVAEEIAHRTVTTNGDWEVTFHLKRPQPAFLMSIAGDSSGIYPCHVSPAEMRRHPIGTGPFKFVEFKPNEDIKVTRNPDYWKPGRPYLDGIEYTIIKDPGTANLAFIAGKFDITFPLFGLTIPLMKNIESQMPQVICELNSGEGINRHLLVNYQKPPFDNPEFRRAMAFSINRQAFVDTIAQGEGQIGGVLQPPPDGLWGMPPDEVKKLPGYDPDVEKNRAEGRRIMQQLGYGPDKHLDIKVTTRNVQPYRDPAVLLIDQLKHVYIDGELDEVDTPQYFPKIIRKDFTVALNLQTSGPDPDPLLHLFYGCGSSLNWDGYCNPEVDQLIEQQSREGNPERRKPILWEIERRLAADVARPILFHARGVTCREPWVKGFTQMENSHFNGWRMEDVWLDK